jgi:hypothetical protein
MLDKVFFDFLNFFILTLPVVFFLYQTKIRRPIRIIGDPDNQRPDKRSSVVFGNREGLDSIGTMVRLGRFGFRVQAGSRHFSLFQNVLIASEAPLAPYSVGTGVLF